MVQVLSTTLTAEEGARKEHHSVTILIFNITVWACNLDPYFIATPVLPVTFIVKVMDPPDDRVLNAQ